ncbi:peptide ABC transporter substrate-binding protein [Candidatus Uhrbacteria bacterium]|nr:peptide ABC transporter substrate-binding protein [Candidatus Uhrbacteria bacterium]
MHIYSPRWWKKGKTNHTALDQELVTSLSPFRFPRFKQLKYLPKILSRQEYLVIKALLVVIVVNVVFLGWRGYVGATTPTPSSGGIYTEGLVGFPRSINPVLVANNDVDRDLVNLVFSGLLRYDSDRKIIPDLAESYEVSQDEKTYTFYLKKNIQWHDGEPLTADDVVFTFSRVQDQRVKSPYYASYKDVRIEKKDDSTVQFILPAPFAPFLDLATRRIVPQHAWREVAPENFFLSALNVKPIGSGMWKFHSLKKDRDGTIRSYTLVRNDNYYGTKPFLQKFAMKFYPDVESAIQALKNGNVDGISFLPRELRDRLVQHRGLQYYTFHLPQYTALFFNQYQNADLKAKAVRQALAYSIDKERLVREILKGEGSVIHAPILPGFVGYDEAARAYALDLEKARGLLETAGWKKDTSGMYGKEERTDTKKNDSNASKTRALKITLTTVNTPENSRVAEVIKENWESLGVGVELQVVESTVIKNEVIDPRNYQALLYGEIIGSDPDLYPFWHSSQSQAPGLNLSVYSNSDADTLLEQGRQVGQTEKRAEIYKKFQGILTEELPAIFLYNPTYNYVVSSDIQGVSDKKQIVYPSDRFVDIANWYKKSKRILKK